MAFGFVTVLAALDPVGRGALLKVIVALYVLRIANKIVFRNLFTEAFETTDERVWIDVGLLALFGGAVFLLRP